MKIGSVVKILSLAVVLAPAGLQGSIINNSFETPVQSAGGFTYLPTGAGIGWVFTGNSGIAANSSPWYAGSAPDGVQAAFIQSGTNSGFSQSISLTVGDIYDFSFLDAERPSYPADTITVSLNSVVIGTYTPSTTTFTLQTTSQIVATSANETLSFVGVAAGPDSGSAIDNVTVADLGPSAAPEPGTLFLLVPALGGLAIVVRRRFTADRP